MSFCPALGFCDYFIFCLWEGMFYVGKDHHSVLGHVQINLEGIHANLHGISDRTHGVFRVRHFVASMGDDLGAFAMRSILSKGKGSLGRRSCQQLGNNNSKPDDAYVEESPSSFPAGALIPPCSKI